MRLTFPVALVSGRAFVTSVVMSFLVVIQAKSCSSLHFLTPSRVTIGYTPLSISLIWPLEGRGLGRRQPSIQGTGKLLLCSGIVSVSKTGTRRASSS